MVLLVVLVVFVVFVVFLFTGGIIELVGMMMEVFAVMVLESLRLEIFGPRRCFVSGDATKSFSPAWL